MELPAVVEKPKPEAAKSESRPKPATADRKSVEEDEKQETKVANQSIRMNVDTLEKLMTMVSELVLTRNQLL